MTPLIIGTRHICTRMQRNDWLSSGKIAITEGVLGRHILMAGVAPSHSSKRENFEFDSETPFVHSTGHHACRQQVGIV